MSISVQEFKKSVVGIEGMDIYNDVNISNIFSKKHKWKYMARPGIQTRDPCITSKVLYHWAIQAN